MMMSIGSNAIQKFKRNVLLPCRVVENATTTQNK